MPNEWHDLTDLTGDRGFVVTGVRLKDSGIAIDGEFEPPLLAGLRYEDQVFVGEFVRCHGLIKHMEKAFGVSYPTIKNRLNRIASRLQLVQIDTEPVVGLAYEVLDLLERGEISPEEAAERGPAMSAISAATRIDVRVRERRESFHLVPSSLWPLLLIIVGFLLLVAVIVDVALLVAGARYHHYTLFLLRTMQLLAEIRGTHVRADTDSSLVSVDIY
jgi:hypothetical protein